MLLADSEHSAIFQCLQGVPEGGLRRVILTASGGAFRDFSKDALFSICVWRILMLFRQRLPLTLIGIWELKLLLILQP